jgi:hypothetical protein
MRKEFICNHDVIFCFVIHLHLQHHRLVKAVLPFLLWTLLRQHIRRCSPRNSPRRSRLSCHIIWHRHCAMPQVHDCGERHNCIDCIQHNSPSMQQEGALAMVQCLWCTFTQISQETCAHVFPPLHLQLHPTSYPQGMHSYPFHILLRASQLSLIHCAPQIKRSQARHTTCHGQKAC